MAEIEEELKSVLMKAKEESEKAGWKLSIQKTKIMASSPITSRQIDGEKVEGSTWQILFYWATKSLQMVTAAMKLKDIRSLEEKLWPTYSIIKSRDTTLPTKVCLVKDMVFPAVMYRCESWTIKKAECQRTGLSNCGAVEDSRVPWTARRLNRSILKEINPENSVERLMLKLQYFDHLI